MGRLATWRPPLWLVVILMAGTLALGSGVGYVRGAEENSGNCTESEAVCAEFSNFWEVWNLAEERFVDPDEIVPPDMIEGAINGMLDSLGDQGHTRYLTAELAQRNREELSGSYEGIGAYFEVEGGFPVIVAPIEGSPAEAAGILAGDLILRINGETTEGLLSDEVAERIRGPEGTEVTLEVLHEGEELPVEITIKRAEVTIPAVTWRMLPNDVAHVRLSQFSEGADEELRQALNEARDQGARALIMDVRNNPGGLLPQATAITGMFVEKGKTVLIQEDRDGEQEIYRSEEDEPLLDLPMVVLINSGSASSAEIFAGALQDYERATVVGVPTAGTGTVLNLISLDDGSELLLGVSQWKTPEGRYLRREGVEPDVTVALPPGVRPLTPSTTEDLSDEEILNSEDLQLNRALDILGGNKEAAMAPPRFWAR